MPDPRVKIPTEPFTFRLHIPRHKELGELAKQYGVSKNLAMNMLIEAAHKKLIQQKGKGNNGTL